MKKTLIKIKTKNISLNKNQTNQIKFNSLFKDIKNYNIDSKNKIILHSKQEAPLNITKNNQSNKNNSSNITKNNQSNKNNSSNITKNNQSNKNSFFILNNFGLNNIHSLNQKNAENIQSNKEDSSNIEKNNISKKIKLVFHDFSLFNKFKNFSEHNKKEIKFNKKYTIKEYSDIIQIFPSKKIISINGKSIVIFDENFKKIQHIKKAHNNEILYISIKDDNNFITSSYDDLIKIWTKKNNNDNFIINHIIENSHQSWIYGLIYYQNDKIISCSHDCTIKLWYITNNFHQCISIIKNFNSVDNLFLIEEKNILISSGGDGLKKFDLIELKCIKENEKAYSIGKSEIIKFNDEKIILKGDLDYKIKIVKINNLEIDKILEIGFKCYSVCILEKENLILFSGKSKDLKIYDYNFECVKVIENFCNQSCGLCKINNCSFLSFEDEICLWQI